MKTQKRKAMRLVSMLLALMLILSGCTGNGTSSSGSGTDDSTISTGSESGTSENTVDFSKYNAYFNVAQDIYEIDYMLNLYFTTVQYQPEFALADGMDYSALEELSYSPMWEYHMEAALGYVDEDPVYPQQDTLIQELNQPYMELLEAFQNLANYFPFAYKEDNMAQAADLHEKLYTASIAFDKVAWSFEDSMTVLDQETEQIELDRLQAEGLDIIFYSRTLLNISYEMDSAVWSQMQAAGSTAPALDMTDLESLYAQYQETYSKLTAALDDPDEVSKIYHWNEGATWSEIYHEGFLTALEELNTAAAAFMDAARNQTDYTQSYQNFYEAISDLADEYSLSFI